MIKLGAGLGNPGDKYKNTRHNIGFDVINILAERLNISWSDKYDGAFAEIKYNKEKLFLLKPYTFMNLSGKSVAAAANFYKIIHQDILIIHDEMNIPFNILKLRHNGSAGGHNGLKSIIECLGSQDFPRLKMGIGRDNSKDVSLIHLRHILEGYVLGKYKPEETALYENFLNKGADAVIDVLNNGLQKAMTVYNK